MKSKVGLWVTQSIRFNKLPNTIYQTKSALPNLFLGDQTKSIEPNLPKQTLKTESANQMYQAKCWKYKESNIPNQIYSIKPTNLNQSNQYYQTKSK